MLTRLYTGWFIKNVMNSMKHYVCGWRGNESSEITQFWVTKATSRRAWERYVNLSSQGHRRVVSLFQCIVSYVTIDNIFIRMCAVYLKGKTAYNWLLMLVTLGKPRLTLPAMQLSHFCPLFVVEILRRRFGVSNPSTLSGETLMCRQMQCGCIFCKSKCFSV